MHRKSTDILGHFPYPQAREIQKQALELLGNNWNDYDVFVISGPTAFGKSGVAKSLMNAFRSVSVITPTNLLVNQFLAEFPGTETLHRMDSYMCEEWKRPCVATRSKLKKFCHGCTCSSDIATAMFRKGPGIYNYYTYAVRKIFRDVLVVDEAHNLIPVIKDMMSVRMWQHDLHYPDNMYKPEQVLKWIAGLPPKKQKNKKILQLKEAVSYQVPEYIMQRTREWFNGKGTLRNEPEERDCIRLLPVDISQAPAIFWPQEVQKIVLMSATIGPKDIEQLGLSRKRILYIDCKSPIPAENRPFQFEPVIAVNRDYLDKGDLDKLVEYIEGVADYHSGEKGIIHCSYELASMLRGSNLSKQTMPGSSKSRYLFHDKYTKNDVYKTFRAAPPSTGQILVACGMYEGLDLPEDAGRWQIIAKVPWVSLANPAVAHLAELDPELFQWETIKTFVQACGRICRTPTDTGTTYCPDSTFLRLWKEASHMFPDWWKESITPYSWESLGNK